ncbi:transposable element Tcb2 transposase [Trichonephila clavipes]|nr:transposable element Tcb2 transposase [Trichonephila clavipes]
MIGKIEEGRSLTNVPEEIRVNKNVISLSWKAFPTIGTAVRKVSDAHHRKTTTVDDRYIILQVKRARYQSVSAISQQLCIASVTAYCGQMPSQRCLICPPSIHGSIKRIITQSNYRPINPPIPSSDYNSSSSFSDVSVGGQRLKQ